MAFCGECGAKIDDNMRFCPECGASVPANQRSAILGVAHEATAAEKQAAANLIMHDVHAPAEAGEVVLSSWQGGGAAPDTLQETAKVVAGAAQTAQQAQGAGRETQDATQTKRKKSKFPLVPVILGAAVIAIVVLFVVPLFVPHPNDPFEGGPTPPSSSQSSTSSNASTSASASTSSSTSTSKSSTSATASSTASTSSATNKSTNATASKSTSATSSDKTSGTAASTASSAAASGTKSSTASTTTSSAASTAKSSSATSAKSATNFSTTARPKLQDFTWLTGEAAKGNMPSGAKRLTSLGDIAGGWKVYIFGDGMERLLNANIDVGQSAVTITLDWYYMRNAAGKSFEDDTPNSKFSGTFDGGALEATGSGKVNLATFWQQNNHQYAVGSFMWADGAISTIALVRP